MRHETLHDRVQRAGYKQFYLAENEDSDVYTFRRGKVVVWFSQDEGSWGAQQGKKTIAEGNLYDSSLDNFLKK